MENLLSLLARSDIEAIDYSYHFTVMCTTALKCPTKHENLC